MQLSLLCANHQGFNSVSPEFENVWPIGSKLKAEKSTFNVSIDDLFTKIGIWCFPKLFFSSAKVIKSNILHFNTYSKSKNFAPESILYP